jgi:hypothetical protein
VSKGRLWLLIDHKKENAFSLDSFEKYAGWTELYCSIQDSNFYCYDNEPSMLQNVGSLRSVWCDLFIALHIANTKTTDYNFCLDEEKERQQHIQFKFPFWFVLVLNVHEYICISVEDFTDFVKWKKLLKQSLPKTSTIIQQKIWEDEGPY